MSTRNLQALFEPKSIALVGASNQLGSVGEVLTRNMFGAGFSGPIMPVAIRGEAVRSAVSYRTVGDLPVTPDLAVIATPPATVPGLVAELAARGCRAAVVITAGFGEGGREDGERLRRAMLEAGRPYTLRTIGPNCLGFISPARGINASFAQLQPVAGDMALVTQSGAVATTMLDWAAGAGLGFSHVISLGDMSDVDFGDLLDYLALDPATRSILLYVESITSARKFMSAARIAARAKPVIVVKSGRSPAGAKAALSHTGALAGADAVYDAAFRRAGMLRVGELRELFDAADTLASGLTIDGERLIILTNGGGLGVMAVDALEARGAALPLLSEALAAKLEAVLPAAWSRGNPVDILGDADGARYDAAFKAIADSREADAILVMNCPTGVGDRVAAARSLAQVAAAGPPVLTAWLGEATAAEARQCLRTARLPSYETPEEAVRAFQHLVTHRRNRRLLMESPPAMEAPAAGARDAGAKIVRSVLEEGRTLLTAPEAAALLAAYDVPVVETHVATTPEEAGAVATRLGGVVALKILSREITHKSDVGGVRLGVPAAKVAAEAEGMLKEVARRVPGARIDGVTVQPMAGRPGAHELILGVAEDATFGPVVVVGHGGVAVEVMGDRAMALPPLNTMMAREMISRTRVSKLLAGYRNVPPADTAAVERAIVRLSELLIDRPEVVELDINPFIVDADGALALDARVVVREPARDPDKRLAICPYPVGLTATFTLATGEAVSFRAVRPQDNVGLLEMIRRCDPEEVRPGFVGPSGAAPADLAERLSQIDYDREMTLVALVNDEIVGLVRTASDPNFEAAEFWMLVRDDMRRRGLGSRLLQTMLGYVRSRGLRFLNGTLVRGNAAMAALGRDLGAAVRPGQTDDMGVLHFDLTG